MACWVSKVIFFSSQNGWWILGTVATIVIKIKTDKWFTFMMYKHRMYLFFFLLWIIYAEKNSESNVQESHCYNIHVNHVVRDNKLMRKILYSLYYAQFPWAKKYRKIKMKLGLRGRKEIKVKLRNYGKMVEIQ